MKHSLPSSQTLSSADGGLSAVDYVRLPHLSGSAGKVSFTIVRSRDDAITRTYSVETAFSNMDGTSAKMLASR